MKKTTVLIVDDSALIRQIFAELLSSDPNIEVLDTAIDPFDAREKIKKLNPDVVTLDIEMPKMDGISFLEKIMTLRPMPVIMASTLTQKGADATLRALELGAFDYISKPVDGGNPQTLSKLKDELISKVLAASQANMMAGRTRQTTPAHVIAYSAPSIIKNIIAIGSSTGGVEALRDIFAVLPASCPPIVMTQHMPATFTKSFATRLNTLSQVTVSEAIHGAKLKQGHAYLAPGDQHMTVIKKGADYFCQLNDGERVSGHKPSVDVLFDSVADHIGTNAIGIILTGMGKDGAQGMLKMREKGAYNIGQNADSCVVYGMPKAAYTIGAVHKELPLHQIAAHALSHCASGLGEVKHA